MEFTELIRTAKVDNVTLHIPGKNKMTGTLCLSSHHIIFASRSSDHYELMVLYMAVESMEKRILNTSGIINILTKDFSIYKFKIPGQEESFNIASSIEALSTLESAASYYPFFFNQFKSKNAENGWETFYLDNEYNKIIGTSEQWRISEVNKNYEVCLSYPEKVIVPSIVTDEILKKSACFRQEGRFPVLCFLYNGKVPLLRSSQPLNGSNNKKSKEDQRLLSIFLHGFPSKGVVIDTRQHQSAQSSKGRGGGFETEDHYPQWKRMLQNIERPYCLSESISRLYEACQDTKSWLSKLESSGWLGHVQDLLAASLYVAKLMNFKNGAPVLIHGDRGSDCTLQITSLVQILLNPECRTIKGFESLIVREWLWGGHAFTERHMKIGLSSLRKKENMPVFLLFLDCVYQIWIQYPTSFEFTEEFLAVLANHSYASQYGTFLFNNEWQRKQAKLEEKTISLWSYINSEEQFTTYLSPCYEYNKNPLWPSCSPQVLVLWKRMFLRNHMNTGIDSDESIREMIKKSKSENLMLKEKVAKLQAEYLQMLKDQS